jgi:hypothetical protein
MSEDNNQLHVFANDVTEWVVAYNHKDAVKVWEETVGETYIPDEYGGDFSMVDDEAELTIDEEETIEPRPIPAGAVLVENLEHSKVYRATMRAWADVRGRCYLCSTEY